MTYYKVVSIRDHQYKSAMEHWLQEYALTYQIGVTTTPKIGYIYAFTSENAAFKFYKAMTGEKAIFSGNGEPLYNFGVRPTPIAILPSQPRQKIVTLWKGGCNPSIVSTLSDESILLKNFTPHHVTETTEQPLITIAKHRDNAPSGRIILSRDVL